MSDESPDPKVREMVARLPIMRNGKPRRFRKFCECFEWVFNAHHQPDTVRVFGPKTEIARAELLATALWFHQNPRFAR